MFRVAYRSTLRADVGIAEIDAILANGAAHNAANGVSSALLLAGRRCLHALEGPPHAVRSTLERIWDDHRHDEFAVIDMAGGEPPFFEGWPLKIISETVLFETPSLRDHPGVIWLAELEGGLNAMFPGQGQRRAEG